MERTLKIIVGVLAIGALVLGYLIYVRDYKPLAGTTPEAPSTSVLQTPSQGTNISSGSSYQPTAEEKKALLPPGPGATAAEQQAFSDLVNSVAKQASYLDLGDNCAVKPVVISLKKGFPLKIKNSSTVEQTIFFGTDTVLTVAANTTREFKTDFAARVGIYGYGCGPVRGAIGMLLVTE